MALLAVLSRFSPALSTLRPLVTLFRWIPGFTGFFTRISECGGDVAQIIHAELSSNVLIACHFANYMDGHFTPSILQVFFKYVFEKPFFVLFLSSRGDVHTEWILILFQGPQSLSGLLQKEEARISHQSGCLVRPVFSLVLSRRVVRATARDPLLRSTKCTCSHKKPNSGFKMPAFHPDHFSSHPETSPPWTTRAASQVSPLGFFRCANVLPTTAKRHQQAMDAARTLGERIFNRKIMTHADRDKVLDRYREVLVRQGEHPTALRYAIYGTAFMLDLPAR